MQFGGVLVVTTFIRLNIFMAAQAHFSVESQSIHRFCVANM